MQPWTRTLADLRRRWPDGDVDRWPDVVRRSTTMSVGALVVTGLVGVEQLAFIDRTGDVDPQVTEALERFAPGIDPETIGHYPTEALQGLESALRGSLFEVVVADRAARGEIDLPAGAHELRLVDDFSTPGYDAVLHNADGDVIGTAQLKTSDSADIVVDHLDRYPDIDIVLASTEAARDAVARGIPNVIDTGVSNAELKSMVAEFLSAHSVDGVGVVLDGIVPEAAYLAIAVQLAWRLLRGGDVRVALSSARSEAVLATALALVATACSVATGTELVRIPVVVAFGAARLHIASVDRSTYNVRLLGEAARSLARPERRLPVTATRPTLSEGSYR